MKKIIIKNLVISIIFVLVLCLCSIYNFTIASDTDTLIWVDTPTQNQSVEKGKLDIQGWMLSEYEGANIQILLDNNILNSAITRQERTDVINSVQGYGGRKTNPKPGFKATVDLSNVSKGAYVLKVRVVKKDGKTILKENSINIRVDMYDTLIWVDNPNISQTEYGKLSATGWVMSSSKNTKIEAYVDGKEIKENINRIKRNDVINAIQGYGGENTNPTPGFNVDIDISDLKAGSHTFTFKIYTQSGDLLETKETSFNIRKADTLLQSDYPINKQTTKNPLHIQGWVMSEDSKNKVEIIFNGTTYQAQRQKRNDVINAIQGYGGSTSNATPGYSLDIDISNIKDGNYTVTTRVVSAFGDTLKSDDRTIKIHKYDSLIQLDTPSVNQKVKSNIDIQGWALSEDKNAKVEVKIGNQTYQTSRQERQDVLNAIQGYGGKEINPTPGFKTTISTEKFKDGNNTINIVITGKTGETIKQISRNIIVHKYDGMVNIDEPSVTMVNGNSIKVQGWELSESKNSNIKIYIDNKQVSTTISRQERQDVLNAVKGYGGKETNPTPGFMANIDISSLGEGKHILKVSTLSNLEDIIASSEKTIQVYHNKYFGIDVSNWQGTIDFDTLLNSKKLDFMIAKAGEYWESRGALQVDKQFDRNYAEAKKRGIPLGTYLYSYATNVDQARTEANQLVNYLKSTGKTFELPVFFDIEDNTQNSLSKQAKTDICIAFGEIVQNAGYKVGIYSSKYWLTYGIDLNQIPSNYDIWVASFGMNDGNVPASKYEFAGNHDIWQYTSTGKIPGISGNVDFNISYKKY